MELPENGPHDFDDTVVAILDSSPEVRDAAEGLREAGYEFEILRGEEGRAHLDPDPEDGLVGTVRRLVNAFGDQQRILERLDSELANGRSVISVETDPDDAGPAIEVLRDHGGDYIWKLGTWTFTRIGD